MTPAPPLALVLLLLPRGVVTLGHHQAVCPCHRAQDPPVSPPSSEPQAREAGNSFSSVSIPRCPAGVRPATYTLQGLTDGLMAAHRQV